MAKYTIEQINEKIPSTSWLTAIRMTDKTHSTPNGTRLRMARFKCKCGKVKNIILSRVISGNTNSCGCRINNRLPRKYSVTIKAIRTCYTDMIGRCYNPKFENYSRYGAIGVTVCDEWRNDYQTFLDWALKNGWSAGLQLDKDKLGDGMLYSPSTCCWLTFNDNQKYKKTSKRYFYIDGEYTIDELSKKYNINSRTLQSRITTSKFSIEKAIKYGK